MLFLGLIVFLFLIVIRPQDFVPGIQGKPVVFIVMLSLLIAWVLSPLEKRIFRSLQDKFVGLFFFSIIISTLSVNWITYSIDITVEVLKLALIYCSLVSIINDKGKFLAATWVMIFFMSAVALMGVLQYHGHDITRAGMAWASDKQVWQIKGVGNYDNPNDLAYSVMLIVPFALSLFMRSNVFTKVLAVTFFAIAIYCIYLTKSRGGYLAAGCSALIWFYLWVDHRVVKRVSLIVVVSAALISFVIQTKDYRGDASSMGRVEAWATGMSLVQTHPLTGVGKDRFIEYHERDSHSSYVRAGSELGLLGLYAYLGIIYMTVRSLKLISNNKEMKVYYTGFASYIGAYLVASMFSSRSYDIIFLVIVGFISAFHYLLVQDTKQENETKEVVTWGKLLNKKIFFIMVLVLITWKAFLIQVW